MCVLHSNCHLKQCTALNARTHNSEECIPHTFKECTVIDYIPGSNE